MSLPSKRANPISPRTNDHSQIVLSSFARGHETVSLYLCFVAFFPGLLRLRPSPSLVTVQRCWRYSYWMLSAQLPYSRIPPFARICIDFTERRAEYRKLLQVNVKFSKFNNIHIVFGIFVSSARASTWSQRAGLAGPIAATEPGV